MIKKESIHTTVGIIGGSGLYEIEGLTDIREYNPTTPYGRPSSPLVLGKLEGLRVAFLARHGQGHRIAPSDINYRANIFALKQLGVEWILSVSAVGSMREDIEPGQVVIPDQFFDHTRHRINTFFGGPVAPGIVAHVGLADPVCPTLANLLADACGQQELVVHRGGTYLCIEGPQFSSKGESRIYRKWGVDIIGMTNVPEAKLAREAEICYSTIAMVTDYDCWHETHASVTVDAILKTLHRNVECAKGVIRTALTSMPIDRSCPCESALNTALVTAVHMVPLTTRRRLTPLLARYIGSQSPPPPDRGKRAAKQPQRRLALVPKSQGKK